MRQAVREQFGGLAEGIAFGVKLRHHHGSQFMNHDFQCEIRIFGLESSPAFVREPEGNGWIERFFRTFGEQRLRVRRFETLEELAEALGRIPPSLQRTVAGRTAPLPIPAAGSPGPACPRDCRMTIIQKTVQEIGGGTLEGKQDAGSPGLKTLH